MCSACVGRLPSSSETIYCSRPAWPYSPCLMQTARPVFVCLRSDCHRGESRAGLRGAVGWSGRLPLARSALSPLCTGAGGSVPPAPAREGQLLQFPAPLLALGWGSPGALPLATPGRELSSPRGERRGMGEGDWCSRVKQLSALQRRNRQADREK